MHNIDVFAVARHASERMSSYELLTFLAIVASVFGLDFGLARLLNYLVFQLPNSRTLELEGQNNRLSDAVQLTRNNS